MTSALQEELLKSEETFLRNMQAKMHEQLNRLKVEEVALMTLLGTDFGPAQSQNSMSSLPDNVNADELVNQESAVPTAEALQATTSSSTATLFSRNNHVMHQNSVDTFSSEHVKDLTTVNQTPLGNLQPYVTQVKQDSDQEIEEMDDET